MTQLLQKLRISSSNRLIRIVALSTAGSGILYLNRDTDSKTFVSVSFPAPLRDSFSRQCQIMKEIIRVPSTLRSNLSPYGNVELLLSRIGSDPSEDVNKDASGKIGDGSRSIATAVAMVLPAVVYISVPRRNGKTLGTGRGTGTLIDPDGTILTCAHVVVDFNGSAVTSKGKVDVTLQDGRIFVGTVVNADLHSDIAIVKINSRLPLPSAELGSSSNLHSGDWAVALGSPLSLRNTVTVGVVSHADRKSSEIGLGGMLRYYVQVDCATNPGNSGGPIVDLDGKIVGVHSFRLANSTGLCFAVASDSVFKAMEHFKKNGRVVRPWLGMKMLDIDKAIVSHLKDRDPMFPDVNKGVLVVMVTPMSPADIAGFQPGDVVIEFQGKPVGSITEVTELMEDQVGVPLKVVVKRSKDTCVFLTVVPEETNPEVARNGRRHIKEYIFQLN